MFNYKFLSAFIKKKGYNLDSLAKEIGIKTSTLSAILNGEKKCSAENYGKLCILLQVPFETFIKK